MFIRDVIQARAELAMQREAVRILHAIMNQLDVTPSPDGTTRCRFEVDDAFLDRLGVWASVEAEFEDGGDTDTDGTDDCEPDDRTLAPLRDVPAVIALAALPRGPLLTDAAAVTAILGEVAEIAAAA